MCAGITTFNALRHSGALPSDLVAVQANKFGYRVAAIGRGLEKATLARKLELIFILTARRRMLPPSCRNSAGRKRLLLPEVGKRWRL